MPRVVDKRMAVANVRSNMHIELEPHGRIKTLEHSHCLHTLARRKRLLDEAIDALSEYMGLGSSNTIHKAPADLLFAGERAIRDLQRRSRVLSAVIGALEQYARASKSMTILVQNSDAQHRAQVCGTLLRADYEVLEAVNAQHAEALCRQKGSDVDLIIAEARARSSPEWKQLCPRAELIELPSSTHNFTDDPA